MATHEILIPNWHPKSVNAIIGVHPKTVGRIKQKEYNFVGVYAVTHDVPKARHKRRVSLTLGVRGRGPDKSNLWKILLDALVACRLLVDDSAGWCEEGEVTYFKLRPGEKKWTRITLEDLPTAEPLGRTLFDILEAEGAGDEGG